MNAPILTPLALANAEVLRALRDQDFNTVADLARLVDRDADNLRKSLKALEKAGLLQLDGGPKHPRPVLVDLGHQALDALDRAEASPPAQPPTSTIFAWQIRADPHNPRKDFDSEEAKAALAELSASIVRDGLIENLVLRPVADMTVPHPLTDQPCPAYMLIAGERRFRAILEAMTDGHLPEDWPIPHTVREVDEVTARRLALVENLQRRDLKPLEEARALQQLVELDGRSTADIAQDIGFTQRWAQQRLQLLQLSPAMQALLDDGRLKIEGARTVLAIWDRLPTRQRQELEAGHITPDQAKTWLDAQPIPLSDAAKLALCEFAVKAEREPHKVLYSSEAAVLITARTVRTEVPDSHTRVKVVVEDSALDELVKRMIFAPPTYETIEGIETGRHYLSRRYYSDNTLREAFAAAMDPAARDQALKTLRVQLHGLQVDAECEETGRYATAWLNADTAIAADLQAEIDKRRQAVAERQAQNTARREQEEADRAAARQVHIDRLNQLKAAEAELVRAEDPSHAAQALAMQTGLPLPWWFDEATGEVIAANGLYVETETLYTYQAEEKARRRLMVALANASAGMVSPAAEPRRIDPGAMPREDFLRHVVGALLEDCDDLPEGEIAAAREAEERAERGLDAWLARGGLVYGQDDYSWDEDDALELACEIRENGLGRQLDIEDAIDAGGEDVG